MTSIIRKHGRVNTLDDSKLVSKLKYHRRWKKLSNTVNISTIWTEDNLRGRTDSDFVGK